MTRPWGRWHGHDARRCEACGDWFYPKYGWEPKCYPCWKSEQQDGPRPDWAKKPEPEKVFIDIPVPVIDPRLPDVNEWQSMLIRIIRLAHPDRHGNSEEANDVTRWLLEQRRRLNGGAHAPQGDEQ